MNARLSVIMTGALLCAAAARPAAAEELATPASTTPPLAANGSVELATPVNLLPLAAALQTEYPGASAAQIAWGIYRENPGGFALTPDGPQALLAHLQLPAQTAVWSASSAQAATAMQALTPRLQAAEFAQMTAPLDTAPINSLETAVPAASPSLRLAGDYVQTVAPATVSDVARALQDRYPRAKPEQIQWALYYQNPDAFAEGWAIRPGTTLRLPTAQRVSHVSARRAARIMRAPGPQAATPG